MSVLCCRVPELLWTLHRRNQPVPPDAPVALVSAEGTVGAVSPAAQAAGVQVPMTIRQAQARCPELVLQPLPLAEGQAAQGELLSVLTGWGLPVEESGWGRAYLDLHEVAQGKAQVQPLAVELGRQVRTALGCDLAPAIGWDSGKFTARAAATLAGAGRVRLVAAEQEVPFLGPLPVQLLPLPAQMLQELGWLGITTLGQLAALPPTAVGQRFGRMGRLAQRLAQGQDPRPVHATTRASFEPLTAPIDPPTGLLTPVVETLLELLRPHLSQLSVQLSGCRQLHLKLGFVDDSERTLDIRFVEPLAQERPLLDALTHHLQTLPWPAAVAQVAVTGLETGELLAGQLALWPEVVGQPDTALTVIARLRTVYGAVFVRGQVLEPTHPLPERRSRYEAWP